MVIDEILPKPEKTLFDHSTKQGAGDSEQCSQHE